MRSQRTATWRRSKSSWDCKVSARAGENRPLLAITLMFGATFAFVAMQAVVKVARLRGFAASEVMFYRTAPGLPLRSSTSCP